MKIYANKSSLEDVLRGVQTRLVSSPKMGDVKDPVELVTLDELEGLALSRIADALEKMVELRKEQTPWRKK